MTEGQLRILFEKLTQSALSPEDQAALTQLWDDPANAGLAYELLDAWYDKVVVMDRMSAEETDQMFVAISRPGKPVSKTISFKTIMRKTRWMAAAVLILAIGLGIYYFGNQSSKLPANIGGTGGTVGTKEGIAPGTNRAILTINNNQNIDLSSDKTGININKSITYNDGEKIAETGQMLQLTTPRGGQYQAVLPDGSRVWLNAASSIKFPSTFTDKERRVEVTGEVYMEIAKNLNAPFSVSTGNTVVQVLGTSFNINAYPDEESQRTTLISGSVRIVCNNQTAILQPGQQANILITPITKIRQITVQTTNIEQAIAWKEGFFKFKDVPIEPIMRQLSRWYNLQVVYEGRVNGRFRVNMPRSLPVSQVLEALELTRGVHFKVEGNKITVLP